MGSRINTIMQPLSSLANVIRLYFFDKYMKEYAQLTYGRERNHRQRNWDAIDIAISGLQKVDVPILG